MSGFIMPVATMRGRRGSTSTSPNRSRSRAVLREEADGSHAENARWSSASPSRSCGTSHRTVAMPETRSFQDHGINLRMVKSTGPRTRADCPECGSGPATDRSRRGGRGSDRAAQLSRDPWHGSWHEREDVTGSWRQQGPPKVQVERRGTPLLTPGPGLRRRGAGSNPAGGA